jgi:hypothetical protein
MLFERVMLKRSCCKATLLRCASIRGDSQWSLYWTARDQPVPCQLVPMLAGWANVDQRETNVDFDARHPILIDPQFRIDPVLTRFLARSRFTWLAEGTREAYTKDYRLFFSFLWQRGKYWHEADPDDLLDWESWRRRGQPAGLADQRQQVAAGAVSAKAAV